MGEQRLTFVGKIILKRTFRKSKYLHVYELFAKSLLCSHLPVVMLGYTWFSLFLKSAGLTVVFPRPSPVNPPNTNSRCVSSITLPITRHQVKYLQCCLPSPALSGEKGNVLMMVGGIKTVRYNDPSQLASCQSRINITEGSDGCGWWVRQNFWVKTLLFSFEGQWLGEHLGCCHSLSHSYIH